MYVCMYVCFYSVLYYEENVHVYYLLCVDGSILRHDIVSGIEPGIRRLLFAYLWIDQFLSIAL